MNFSIVNLITKNEESAKFPMKFYFTEHSEKLITCNDI